MRFFKNPKIKKFKILIVFLTCFSFSSFNFVKVYSKGKIIKTNRNVTKKLENFTKNEELVNSKKNDLDMKNYRIEKIINKGEGKKFVVYKHIKSHLTVVVSFNDSESIFPNSSDPFNPGGIFIRFKNWKSNNGGPHLLEHCMAKYFLADLFKDNIEIGLYRMVGSMQMFETPRLNFGFNINLSNFLSKKDDLKEKDNQILYKIKNMIMHIPYEKDQNKTYKSELKRIILELKEEKEQAIKEGFIDETTEYSLERIMGGKYRTAGKVEDVEKLKITDDFISKECCFDPSDILITISARINPNYKEILKALEDRFIDLIEKPPAKVKPPAKNELITTTPLRKIKVNEIPYFDYEKKDIEEKYKKYYKNKARVIYDISNLSQKERDVFRFGPFSFRDILKDYIKELGYDIVESNNTRDFNVIEYDPTQFDGIFYLDFYGNNSENFTEEKLKINSKKLLEKFYEKIKNMNKEDLINTYLGESFSLNNFSSYRGQSISNMFKKSFALADDPISEQFFDIENNEIKDDINLDRFTQNIKTNSKKLKEAAEKNYKYMDIFSATTTSENKKNEKESEFVKYTPPIKFPPIDTNNIKDQYLNDILKRIIQEKFILKDLVYNGLVYDKDGFNKKNIHKDNIEKIKNYYEKELPKKINELVITKEEAEKEKKKIISFLEESITANQEEIEKINKILKNKTKLKKLIEEDLSQKNAELRSLNIMISTNKRELGMIKDKNDEKYKKKEEMLNSLEKNLEILNKRLKSEYSEQKKEFIKQLRNEQNLERDAINKNENRKKEVEKIDVEELNKALKNIKLQKRKNTKMPKKN